MVENELQLVMRIISDEISRTYEHARKEDDIELKRFGMERASWLGEIQLNIATAITRYRATLQAAEPPVTDERATFDPQANYVKVGSGWERRKAASDGAE